MSRARCRDCGLPIVFKRTFSSRNMACDCEPVSVVVVPYKSVLVEFSVMFVEGEELVRVRRAKPEDAKAEQGFRPHGDTCQHPDAVARRQGRPLPAREVPRG